MDIGGPVLGGLEDHGVDEPDERRIGNAVVDLEIVGLLLFLFEQLQLAFGGGGSGAEGLGGASKATELDEDVVTGRHANLERIARGEPQLVDSLDVAGVAYGDLEYGIATTRSRTWSAISPLASSWTPVKARSTSDI